jgi:hypothetical protein
MCHIHIHMLRLCICENFIGLSLSIVGWISNEFQAFIYIYYIKNSLCVELGALEILSFYHMWSRSHFNNNNNKS